MRRTLTPKNLKQLVSLCIYWEDALTCHSLSLMATLQNYNLLLPLICIHLETGFYVYWPVMTYSGQQKWFHVSIEDWVASDDFLKVKFVMSHFVVSIEVSM